MIDEADIAQEESNGHRLFGASKFHRILWCAGSLRAELGMPDTARYEAAEGTVAHMIGDDWLRSGKRPSHMVGTSVVMKMTTGEYVIPITEEMMTHVEQHVSRCSKLPGIHLYEQFVDYSHLTPIPDQGGTLDHAAIGHGWFQMHDLKYGIADKIFAYRNPQLAGYANAVIEAYDWLYEFQQIRLWIHQPRLDHFDVWDTTVEELREFGEWAKGRMAESWQIDAPRTPSEKTCRYCKAKTNCAANAIMLDRIADGTLEDETISGRELARAKPKVLNVDYDGRKFPDVRRIKTPELARLMTYRKPMEKYFEAGFEELSRRVFDGEDAPGWMVAEGRSSRAVSDRSAILRVLKKHGIRTEKAFTVDFLSPAQLETLLVEAGCSKKEAVEAIQPYVSTRPGQELLAPEKRGKRQYRNLADDTFVDETL